VIRLAIPVIEEDDLAAVRDVLTSGFLVQGAQVAAFEAAAAAYVGTDQAIATSNCTTALHAALLALDVQPGDLVLVTAYSWITTANVIELCGAQPVFVDIDPNTFNMDPNALNATLQRLMANRATARRIKAILPVHTFGQMADMRLIGQLASEYNLPIVEDAACALGATLDGQQAGTWGVMGCFSFHPRKAVTTGEGGMITTNDAELARRLRALRNHGQDPNATTTDFIMPGNNYRLTEFQAALGLTQMQKLDRLITARRRLASAYTQLLTNTGITAPVQMVGSDPVYQSYVVMLPAQYAAERASIIQTLRAEGIETQIGTWHMPLTTYFRTRYGYQAGDFPVTDRVFAQALTLPLYEHLTAVQQQLVVTALLEKVR